MRLNVVVVIVIVVGGGGRGVVGSIGTYGEYHIVLDA